MGLLVRNIPPAYTQDMLLEEWSIMGDYDVLFLPLSRKNRNKGYAFVNFLSNSAAKSFQTQWDGKRLFNFKRESPLTISDAQVQGREALLAVLQELAERLSSQKKNRSDRQHVG